VRAINKKDHRIYEGEMGRTITIYLICKKKREKKRNHTFKSSPFT